MTSPIRIVLEVHPATDVLHSVFPLVYPPVKFANNMTVELDWSLDYCLACDKQTSGEAYCCQSCRLADLDRSPCLSEPESPRNLEFSSDPQSTMPRRSPGLQLEPAYDFAAHRTTIVSSGEKNQRASARATTQFSTSTVSLPSHPSSRSLTPSSSRSSLGSVTSNSPLECPLSVQARTELRSYANSFDLIRNWRRQMASP